jgi:hypothetical protein
MCNVRANVPILLQQSNKIQWNVQITKYVTPLCDVAPARNKIFRELYTIAIAGHCNSGNVIKYLVNACSDRTYVLVTYHMQIWNNYLWHIYPYYVNASLSVGLNSVNTQPREWQPRPWMFTYIPVKVKITI